MTLGKPVVRPREWLFWIAAAALPVGAGQSAPCYRSARRVCVALEPRRFASEPGRFARASGAQLLDGCLAFQRDAWLWGNLSSRDGFSEGPCPPSNGLGWRFWPEQLLPSSASLPTCGRLRALLTSARRLAAVARATDPQADGPGFFESTSTSCVPLYATEPADESSDEAACHARRIREECGKRKAELQLFSRATCPVCAN